MLFVGISMNPLFNQETYRFTAAASDIQFKRNRNIKTLKNPC